MKMPRRKAPKLASQNPPGMVTVVLAYPLPRSTPTGSVALAHPQAPPATSTTNRISVLTLTPATVMDRAALAVRWVSMNFSLSAGLPDWSRVDAVAVCAMRPSGLALCAGILAHRPSRPDDLESLASGRRGGCRVGELSTRLLPAIGWPSRR